RVSIRHPWALSFSFGRALQATCIKLWGGKDENLQTAQEAFEMRAKMNGLASTGQYDKSQDTLVGGESLHVARHTY
ncbi:class I fructose-bisphosphate aldolase, partial [Salmonella sp. s51228]|uniref:class I fructose-bisphosphate aldolase n=1 Tax=Salmonella sp. s51228 TaxID=3159652 RepID=UPI00397EF828